MLSSARANADGCSRTKTAKPIHKLDDDFLRTHDFNWNPTEVESNALIGNERKIQIEAADVKLRFENFNAHPELNYRTSDGFKCSCALEKMKVVRISESLSWN